MTKDQGHQINADDVLRDIARELERPAPVGPPIKETIANAKKRQKDFRNVPVLGNLSLLKKLIFGLNRSTFSQQFEINELILELVDDLYYEIVRNQTIVSQRLTQIEKLLHSKQKKDGNGAEQTSNSIRLRQTGNIAAHNSETATLTGLTTIYTAPTEMLLGDRLLLYSLVYSLKPAFCVATGVFRGGSALIICAALEDIGAGRLIAIDPAPKVSTDDWERVLSRTDFIYETSPSAFAQTYEIVKQPFDFVLIDGDHMYERILQDIEAVLPYLAKQATLLFHNCHHPQIKQAIDDTVKKYSNKLIDCGVLSAEKTQLWQNEGTKPVNWGGFRLLRFLGVIQA